MTPTKARWANFIERVVWTLLQAASAEGLIQLWQALTHTDHLENRGLWVVVLTAVLAAVKNAAAQAFGSPTGATLPTQMAQPTAIAKQDPDSPTNESSGQAANLPADTPTETNQASPGGLR